MKLNKNKINFINFKKMYDWRFLKIIIDYLNDFFEKVDTQKIVDFIDNQCINGYGFCEYKGSLYFLEKNDDIADVVDYFEEDGEHIGLFVIGEVGGF